jgi:hypothetical protein
MSTLTESRVIGIRSIGFLLELGSRDVSVGCENLSVGNSELLVKQFHSIGLRSALDGVRVVHP